MKEVKAIIQPFMLGEVLRGLQEIDHLPAATVSEVLGFSVVHPDYEPQKRTKLEIMVHDEMAETVANTIQKHAQTGNAGDGRVFVINIEDTIKIRTGQRDTAV